MANRKRKMVLRCPVTEEERKLIEQKMALLHTEQIGAYLRKMAIDGLIIYTDTTNIKEMNKELQAITISNGQAIGYAKNTDYLLLSLIKKRTVKAKILSMKINLQAGGQNLKVKLTR